MFYKEITIKMSTSSPSSQSMWSSQRDRAMHNLSFDMAASALYIQQQIVLNRSEILLRAVEGGLVPLEDILAFPVNWIEMATSHMTRQKMLQISQSAGIVAKHSSSLGLYIDETSKPSSSRISSSSDIPKRSPVRSRRFVNVQENNGDDEMDAMLSSAVQDTMKDSAGMPIIQDRDETFFYSSLSASSISDLASSPPTSIPPTPIFSIRELSSEPESFPSSPISIQESQKSSFISTSSSLAGNKHFIQPLAKRRKVMENLHLPNLSTPKPSSWWPVSIPA